MSNSKLNVHNPKATSVQASQMDKINLIAGPPNTYFPRNFSLVNKNQSCNNRNVNLNNKNSINNQNNNASPSKNTVVMPEENNLSNFLLLTKKRL